ncbi:hypothetical protein D3C85_1621520 [compost metagenome]
MKAVQQPVYVERVPARAVVQQFGEHPDTCRVLFKDIREELSDIHVSQRLQRYMMDTRRRLSVLHSQHLLKPYYGGSILIAAVQTLLQRF